MSKLFKICIFLVLPALGMYGCGDGDGHNDTTDSVSTASETSGSNMANDKDEEFVEDMLEDNVKAIAWLKAAAGKGTDAQLKTEAGAMLEEHERLDRRLRDLATSKSYDLDELDAGDSTIGPMGDKAGADWDDDWADKMKGHHEKMTNRLTDYSDDARDAELKALINEVLPSFNDHQAKLKALDDRLHD